VKAIRVGFTQIWTAYHAHAESEHDHQHLEEGRNARLMPQQSLVIALVALQFTAFGWRLNREMNMGDKLLRTWLPLPDCLNLLALFAVVLFCVVIPMASNAHARLASATLKVGYTLLVFHPFSEAAHYGLFSKDGRLVYLKRKNGDYPWVTGLEAVIVMLSVIFASIAGWSGWHA
jgi:hypothetical protein